MYLPHSSRPWIFERKRWNLALELAHYLALHRSPLQSDETNELNQAKVGVKTAKNAGFGEKKKCFPSRRNYPKEMSVWGGEGTL